MQLMLSNRLALVAVLIAAILAIGVIAYLILSPGSGEETVTEAPASTREAKETATITQSPVAEEEKEEQKEELIPFRFQSGYGIRVIPDIGIAFNVFEQCGLRLEGGGPQKIAGREVVAPYIVGGRPEPILKGDAYGGVLPTLLSLKPIEQGAPLKVVASLSDASHPIIVVRKDLNVKSPEDLKGLKIATTRPGFPPHLTLLNLLEKVGLSEKDVEIISVSGGPLGPIVLNMLKKGEVDAASLPPQEAAYVLSQGVAKLLEIDVELEKILFTSVIVNSKWAEENPEAVVRLICAVDKILEIIHTEDPEIVADALLNNTPPEIREYYSQFDRETVVLYITLLREGFSRSVEIDMEAVENIIEIAKKLGIVSQLTPEQVVDTKYLEEYLKQKR
ncbi:MAG: ABC transporter substrate-binding protein [Desulfurococcales archaeon]|nr:ABC transporter substrate-binding protein [Desulfurococcales archaeon]